jgi:LmbE family N-acetylglucosaminyl deacetylase
MVRRADTAPFGQFKKLILNPRFAPGYALFGVIVLALTTLFWSILGARLQSTNSDQLVNPLLFENGHTFHNAQFPAAHSQLLKWPLFWLVKLFSFSGGAYVFLTVVAVLVTVTGLALVLYRIEKRPLVFGTLCLALASVLLLVPAQPYAGGLLPVNMAMLATRNLEYLLYIISLWLLIRTTRLRSRSFWLGVAALGLLVASDRLFLSLSLGGALLALVAYALARNWKLVSLAVNWLVGNLLGGAAGFALLWLLQLGGLTHFAGQSSSGPYTAVHGLHSVVLGVIYGIGGLFTNLGANPAYDAVVVRHIPHQLGTRLFGLGGVAYLINILLLVLGATIVWRLLARSVKRSNGRVLDTPLRLALALVWSTLAAVGIFVASNHYYAVDARYLTIVLFAAFVSAAAYTRRKEWPADRLVIAGGVLVIGILLGIVAAGRTYHDQHQALEPISDRNATVGQVLKQHTTPVLLGDYWRVVPIKATGGNQGQPITPLNGCTQPRTILSSAAWQADIRTHGFAYLLSLGGGLTDYPHCSLQQIIDSYGRPNTSALIAGSLKNPQELLLFYDHGAHRSAPKASTKTPATVLPITPDQLPYTTCNGPTVMNFVAHQDDDLLFMNPDILHDIRAGHCIRTVYLTAGDDGGDRYYWLGREQGSEAAYASLTGDKSIWVQRIVELGNHSFVAIANPKGNAKISLVFMHLPDGNTKGEGFPASHNESLARLESGAIKQIHTVDGQSVYTSAQLQAALVTLMHLYLPAEIRTQANFISTKYPDHSDHMAVGRYVGRAYVAYEQQQYAGLVNIPLLFYIGYPIHQLPANISDGDLQAKETAFLAYAKHDGGVCHSVTDCAKNPAYGAYLLRQYTNPD